MWAKQRSGETIEIDRKGSWQVGRLAFLPKLEQPRPFHLVSVGHYQTQVIIRISRVGQHLHLKNEECILRVVSGTFLQR